MSIPYLTRSRALLLIVCHRVAGPRPPRRGRDSVPVPSPAGVGTALITSGRLRRISSSPPMANTWHPGKPDRERSTPCRARCEPPQAGRVSACRPTLGQEDGLAARVVEFHVPAIAPGIGRDRNIPAATKSATRKARNPVPLARIGTSYHGAANRICRYPGVHATGRRHGICRSANALGPGEEPEVRADTTMRQNAVFGNQILIDALLPDSHNIGDRRHYPMLRSSFAIPESPQVQS